MEHIPSSPLPTHYGGGVSGRIISLSPSLSPYDPIDTIYKVDEGEQFIVEALQKITIAYYTSSLTYIHQIDIQSCRRLIPKNRLC
mmetsp:Transcript_16732/g.35360  ORF Transcript_16732/g.35360 Transcript_16732/m.35360 type:complete len:85 (+) Transcript_16732:242-496(+)